MEPYCDALTPAVDPSHRSALQDDEWLAPRVRAGAPTVHASADPPDDHHPVPTTSKAPAAVHFHSGPDSSFTVCIAPPDADEPVSTWGSRRRARWNRATGP